MNISIVSVWLELCLFSIIFFPLLSRLRKAAAALDAWTTTNHSAKRLTNSQISMGLADEKNEGLSNDF